MNMFDTPENEVTLLYDDNGYLIVIIGRTLGKIQSTVYIARIQRLHGVRSVRKVTEHMYCQDCSVYALQGTLPLAISKSEVREYTETYLANLLPEPTQSSPRYQKEIDPMYDLTPEQASMLRDIHSDGRLMWCIAKRFSIESLLMCQTLREKGYLFQEHSGNAYITTKGLHFLMLIADNTHNAIGATNHE